MRAISLAMLMALVLTQPVSAVETDYALHDLNGRKHALSDYRGKWVIVNYGTTFCVLCQLEIPELIRFHAKHAAVDAVVLGVNFEPVARGFLHEFVRTFGINYPILGNGETPNLLIDSVWVLPTTVLIDPYGNLVARHTGPVSAAHIEAMMSRYTVAEVEDKSPKCFT